jgi:hypothetical protein
MWCSSFATKPLQADIPNVSGKIFQTNPGGVRERNSNAISAHHSSIS